MTHPSGSPLTASDLRYALPDGRVVFDGLSFVLGRERTGLVGPNGVGKTLLVRILAGHLSPTGGSVTLGGRVAYLPQERTGRLGNGTVASSLGVEVALAALERIESGSTDADDFDRVGDRWDLRDRIAPVLGRFGLEHVGLERPLSSLSGGEATKIAMAGLLLHEPDLILLDEPTNDLDAESRGALYDWLEEWDGGLLVVSHDRGVLSRVDRIFALSPRGLRSYGGGYDLYRSQRVAEEEAAHNELGHARKELRKAERDSQKQRERQARRTARGRRGRLDGGVPKVLLGARKESAESTGARLGKTAERRVGERRERLDAARAVVEERDRIEVALGGSRVHASLRVLEMSGVRYRYASAAAPVVEDVDLVLTGPERVAVVGANGSGKTTFLRLAMGELEPEAGRVRLGVPRDAVAYLDQRAEKLGVGRSVLDAFRAANPTLDPTESRYVLARYLFPGDAALADVGDLSGGERIRAALACTVAAEHPPSLLLLDEPTNHLDLESLEAVEHVLRAYDGAMLVVSHDEAFLEAIDVGRAITLPSRSGRE